MKMKMEDLIKSNWIAPFQWKDRGPRFLERLEDIESKFAIVEWPKAEEGGKKLKRNMLHVGNLSPISFPIQYSYGNT